LAWSNISTLTNKLPAHCYSYLAVLPPHSFM